MKWRHSPTYVVYLYQSEQWEPGSQTKYLDRKSEAKCYVGMDGVIRVEVYKAATGEHVATYR